MISGLYLKLIAAAVVVAAAIGAWMYVKSLQSENERLTAQVTILGAQLKDQNDAVAALKADADLRLAAAQQQLEAAKAATAAARKRSTIIYRTLPSTPGDACKSALDIVNGIQ